MIGFLIFQANLSLGVYDVATHLLSLNKTEKVKVNSYDSLLIEVNLLMVPKRTFSCFVVDMTKYCGVELP